MGINLEAEVFFSAFVKFINLAVYFCYIIRFQVLEKNLLSSWPLTFPGAEKRLILHADRRNNLSFIRFEIFSFLHLSISQCSGTRGHHAHWDRSREGRSWRTSSCSCKAPIFLPEKSQSKVHLSSLPSKSILCACPVLADWGRLSIIQILWRWMYVEMCTTWTSRWLGHADKWTASVYSGPFCPYLLQTSRSFTLCCFSWDVVPSLKQTWVKWLGSTYPWRCISR